ncbi:putative RDD family membrane protein YckC [Rhodococcus rhodochrous J45]|uniref:Putative RDD family membrane protein YckC n=1 Tax=Rhodococcus rhodochrous J45 TaxID=935266 RepID=A0A562DK99_RHORH|nr:RDD family protein [Rhodococcus rhodochrous]TWH10109.1 putative RDD family membrane protein YckC [Rhodococcus rhodochrous J45]
MTIPEPRAQHRREPETQAAGLGIRFAARVVDALIVGVALLAVLVSMSKADDIVVTIAVTALTGFAYFVVCEALFGATPGKTFLGIRVYGPRSDKPTVPQATVRNLFMLVSAVPYVGSVVDLVLRIAIAVTIHNDASKQGIHDRWAGGTSVRHRR